MRKRAIISQIAIDGDILKLTDFEFRVFILAIANADNYGRFVANGEEFKAIADPRNSKRTAREYDEALDLIAKHKLIRLYTVDGKRYLKFKEKSFEKINKIFVKEKGIPEYPDDHPSKDKEKELMSQEQDLDEYMFSMWGEVWNKFAYIIKQKIVALKLKHGFEKFSKAVAYCAERDIRNFSYLQAMLEPKSKQEKAESRGLVDPITYMRQSKDGKKHE